MNLEPLRAGVAMTWDSISDRDRRLLVYAAVWLIALAIHYVQRRSRDRLRREIVDELTGDGGGTR